MEMKKPKFGLPKKLLVSILFSLLFVSFVMATTCEPLEHGWTCTGNIVDDLERIPSNADDCRQTCGDADATCARLDDRGGFGPDLCYCYDGQKTFSGMHQITEYSGDCMYEKTCKVTASPETAMAERDRVTATVYAENFSSGPHDFIVDFDNGETETCTIDGDSGTCSEDEEYDDEDVGTLTISASSEGVSCEPTTVTVIPENDPPRARLEVDTYSNDVDEAFNFDASRSSDPDHDSLSFRWDFNNDGVYDTDYSSSSTISHSFTAMGDYTITVEVSDPGGLTDTASVSISVVCPAGVRLYNSLTGEFETYCCGVSDMVCPEDYNSPGWSENHVICPKEDPDCLSLSCNTFDDWVTMDTTHAPCDTSDGIMSPYPTQICIRQSSGDSYDQWCNEDTQSIEYFYEI
jgi:hypothetical protein